MTELLKSRGVYSGYAGVPVIRNLDLVLNAGEVVALLGGNGAGKTTGLLTFAGVLGTERGELTVLGESVAQGRPHIQARRGLSLVPDDRSLFFDLTARENLHLARVPKGTTRRQVEEMVLDYFPPLAPKLAVKAGLLSGGEQQMLAVGRALVMQPKILMIDEMSLGLAPLIVQSMLPTVRRIATELGAGVLLVEQHVDLVLKYADRAYVLNRGSVVLEGTAEELRADRDRLRDTYITTEATS